MSRKHYVLLPIFISITGCGEQDDKPIPPGYTTTYVTDKAKCTCTDNEKMVFKNIDPLKRDLQFTKDYTYYKDGAYIGSIQGNVKYNVKYNDEEPVGCRFDQSSQPTSISTEGSTVQIVTPKPKTSATCPYKYEYTVNVKTVTPITSNLKERELLGDKFIPSIDSCLKVCSLPSSPYCYNLGNNASLVNSILQPMYKGVFSDDKGKIYNSDVLSALHLTNNENNCQRTDTSYGGGLAENKAINGVGCTIDLTKIPITKGEPLNAKLYAVDVYGARSTDKSLFGTSSRALEFPRGGKRIIFNFTGDGSTENNEHYAGEIFEAIDTERSTILVTNRSCLLVQKK